LLTRRRKSGSELGLKVGMWLGFGMGMGIWASRNRDKRQNITLCRLEGRTMGPRSSVLGPPKRRRWRLLGALKCSAWRPGQKKANWVQLGLANCFGLISDSGTWQKTHSADSGTNQKPFVLSVRWPMSGNLFIVL